MASQTKVTGVILAGGLARRMDQQDKGLVIFKGQPLVSYALTAINAISDQTIINANRNRENYQKLGFPVVGDQTNTFDGPLAGILTGMYYAQDGVMLVMPCDSPLFKTDHLQQLLNAFKENNNDIAVACDGERLHPVFLALKVSLKASLKAYLASGERKVDTWLAKHSTVKVDFSKQKHIFANINTFDDLETLAKLNLSDG